MRKKLIDEQRRKILGATGGGIVASLVGSAVSAYPGRTEANEHKSIRWGFVGTGSIANRMARAIADADNAELAAISSRKMESAQAFANKYKIGRAFDSWADMMAWDGVDAIFVGTPTSVKEEICTAAASYGKHVVGDKPFASLSSLQRITAACRKNGVGFMDGTHFVHLPRSHDIKARMQENIGWPWSLDAAFQFNLRDRSNIRFDPNLEPYGAVGDAGWYNMRAMVEYLSPDATLRSASTYLRRDEETGAVISGSGVMLFDDGSTSTWNCGFDSGGTLMDLRISGVGGVLQLDDFVISAGTEASYTIHRGGVGARGQNEKIASAVSKPGASLLFEDFAAMVPNQEMIERSMQASERTQMLLDAAWKSGLDNEQG